ncbi:hypothetical protein BC941DRAFT_347680 [Chlamydoabsidia padenii]|nr:hypothetical protein BC941DRAFT_347680 [Chlamydoabsidia padenii]
MAPATKRPLCHVKTQSTTTPFLTEEGKKMTGPTTHCPCCQLPDCYSWKTTTKTIQKLEMETQLAAEIGQSLLQKNEEYMANLDDLKNRRLAQRLNREKDKWMWQYEKSEQILNESIADLETTNDKCAALTKDLEETKLEMEKLQQFKHKSHQFDTREDNLQSKLEDTKQELMISRKNELGWEMKYKKLVTRYGKFTVCGSSDTL